jgi:hypothetical protein
MSASAARKVILVAGASERPPLSRYLLDAERLLNPHEKTDQ